MMHGGSCTPLVFLTVLVCILPSHISQILLCSAKSTTLPFFRRICRPWTLTFCGFSMYSPPDKFSHHCFNKHIPRITDCILVVRGLKTAGWLYPYVTGSMAFVASAPIHHFWRSLALRPRSGSMEWWSEGTQTLRSKCWFQVWCVSWNHWWTSGVWLLPSYFRPSC